jgi:hypothetical protein
MPRACLPFLATAGILAGCRLENRRYVAVRGGPDVAWCHPVSLQKKSFMPLRGTRDDENGG